MITGALANRTTSGFGISIGTDLALESIFDAKLPTIDPERIIPQRVNIGDYQEFWINLSTLYRNLMGSIQREEGLLVTPHEAAEALYEETQLIASLLKVEGLNTTRPIYYACDYSKVIEKYTKLHARLRNDTTDKQKLYTENHRLTLKLFFTMVQDRVMYRPLREELKPDSRVKALLLSHCAYDLISHSHFNGLELIESHTGKLRKKSSWYSKYTNGKDLVMIPFMKGLLPVFGDSELFLSLSPKLRRDMIELAQTQHWSSVTTETKVKYDIEHHLKDKFSATIVKTFF